MFEMKSQLFSHQGRQLILITGYDLAGKIGQSGDHFFALDHHDFLKGLQLVGNFKEPLPSSS